MMSPQCPGAAKALIGNMGHASRDVTPMPWGSSTLIRNMGHASSDILPMPWSTRYTDRKLVLCKQRYMMEEQRNTLGHTASYCSSDKVEILAS